MGTSKSAAELAGKMDRIATTLPRATTQAIKDSSLTGKRTIEAIAATRGVPPNAKIAGRRWSVRYDLTGTATRPTSLLKILGAFPLVENDTPSHRITARRAPGTSNRRRRGARALNIGGNIRASANHPGTRGKHIFRDAKARIVKDTPKNVMGHVVADIATALK